MSLYINTDDGVTFNGVSSVTTADVVASNGVVHIVDGVIGLPSVVTFALLIKFGSWFSSSLLMIILNHLLVYRHPEMLPPF